MKLKSIIVTLVMTVCMSSVHAETYNVGTGPLSYGEHIFSATVPGKESFDDIWNFSLANSSSLEGSASVLLRIVKPTFGFELYSNNNTLLGQGGDGDVFSLPSLAAGSSYYLRVFGEVTSANQGSYSGVLSIAAVPEPETYAMFLAGLGLMGVIARRRRV